MKASNRPIDFIGIGAMKAATSWLFGCLCEHPKICGPCRKELHFFDRDYEYRKGLAYYLSYFDTCRPDCLLGEFTPRYMVHPQTAQRIYTSFPETKIIACLRNPVERTYSHYTYGVQQKGLLSLYPTFADAIEKDRGLLARSFYYDQLVRYYERFPKEHIHIIIYEDLMQDPLRVVQQVFSFLGVDSGVCPVGIYKKTNVTGARIVGTKYSRLNTLLLKMRRHIRPGSAVDHLADRIGMKECLRTLLKNNRCRVNAVNDVIMKIDPITECEQSRLRSIYSRDARQLEQLIGRDLSLWKLSQ
jgi:hypothetical protein